ncbi:recombinase family protein [Rhodococcus hoagii]|nr:recombinase family protein [Prescottella equi]
MRAHHYAECQPTSLDEADHIEQEAECRAICQREGWDVAEVLSDNDVGASRFSRVKDRPAYERLKQVLQAGDVLVSGRRRERAANWTGTSNSVTSAPSEACSGTSAGRPTIRPVPTIAS